MLDGETGLLILFCPSIEQFDKLQDKHFSINLGKGMGDDLNKVIYEKHSIKFV